MKDESGDVSMNKGLKMWTGMVECSICKHQHLATMPIDQDLDEPVLSLECNKCFNMACGPVDEPEEEDQWEVWL